MKKLWIVPLLVFLFACGPATYDAESTVSITAPDGFAVACVAGFTRVAPHMCVGRVTSLTYIGTTLDGVCNSIDLTVASPLAFPANATHILTNVVVQLRAQNAIGPRQIALSFYKTAACSSSLLLFDQLFLSQEYVATGTANWINRQSHHATIPVTNGIMYYIGTLTTCVDCVYNLQPYGYFD